MKLGSIECIQALKKYEVRNKNEKLAIRILLTDCLEIVNIPGLQDMSDEQIDDLTVTINDIRFKLGIEEA